MPNLIQPSPALTASRHCGLDNCTGSGQGGRDVENLMLTTASSKSALLEQMAYEAGRIDGMYRITETPNVDGILLLPRQASAIKAYRRGLEEEKAVWLQYKQLTAEVKQLRAEKREADRLGTEAVAS